MPAREARGMDSPMGRESGKRGSFTRNSEKKAPRNPSTENSHRSPHTMGSRTMRNASTGRRTRAHRVRRVAPSAWRTQDGWRGGSSSEVEYMKRLQIWSPQLYD